MKTMVELRPRKDAVDRESVASSGREVGSRKKRTHERTASEIVKEADMVSARTPRPPRPSQLRANVHEASPEASPSPSPRALSPESTLSLPQAGNRRAMTGNQEVATPRREEVQRELDLRLEVARSVLSSSFRSESSGPTASYIANADDISDEEGLDELFEEAKIQDASTIEERLATLSKVVAQAQQKSSESLVRTPSVSSATRYQRTPGALITIQASLLSLSLNLY